MAIEGQESLAYTDANLATFERYLSSERLAAYVLYARGDKNTAMRLYERNTELSEALYGVLQGLEVTLRNAIHELMIRKTGRPNWFDSFPFQGSEQAEINQAKAKIAERAVVVTPGRIVAELKFGFWVRLFSHAYDKTLWVPHLRSIFPIRLDAKRSFVHGRLVALKTLRNRIAHHERITCGKRDVQKDYDDLLETIAWINPTMRRWVESTNCFPARFAKKLPKRPSASPTASLSPASTASPNPRWAEFDRLADLVAKEAAANGFTESDLKEILDDDSHPADANS